MSSVDKDEKVDENSHLPYYGFVITSTLVLSPTSLLLSEAKAAVKIC